MDPVCQFLLHRCCPVSTGSEETVTLHAWPETPFLCVWGGHNCVTPETERGEWDVLQNLHSCGTHTSGKGCLHPCDLQSLCPHLVLGNLRVTQSIRPWVGREKKAQGLL